MIKVNFQTTIILFGLFYSCLSSNLYSQDSLKHVIDSTNVKDITTYWFTLGVGGNSIGPSDVLSYSQESNSKLYSARWSTSSTSATLFKEIEQEFDTWEFGFLYGFCSKTKRSLISASVGLSLIEIKKTKYKTKYWVLGRGRDIEYTDKTMTIGIPLEAQLNFIPFTDIFGIGLFLFSNLNTEKSYLGFLFSIQLGSF